MPRIELNDIRLSEYRLSDFPRLERLRDDLLNTTHPSVCIERARHVTDFLRDLADPADPPELTRARAVAYFLEHKAPLFPDHNLLAGTTTSQQVGAPIFPELTGLTIWPELDTISTREHNPLRLSRQDAEELDRDIFPFWMDRSVLEVTRRRLVDAARTEPVPPGTHDALTGLALMQRIVFFLAGKAGALSHTVPGYRMALERGVLELIEDAAERQRNATDPQAVTFYRSVQVALRGVIAYAGRLAAEARRLADREQRPERCRELGELADICSRVPAHPPRTFREAINALWILQVAVHAENINMAISPGRLDQVLYPWYRAGIADGSLTVAQAVELVGCLWLKLNDNTNLVPQAAHTLFGGAGTAPAVTLGGVDAAGEDAVNDLTYVMLRATEILRVRDPSVNARIHSEANTPDYRQRVAEVVLATSCVPAMHNDAHVIDTLRHQGVSPKDANDWAVIGCVEPGIPGHSYDASSAILLNLVAALELALHSGRLPVIGTEQIGPDTGDPRNFTSFDQFLEAYRTQLSWLIDKAVNLNEALGRTHQECLPSPLLSALFADPMVKGRDLIHGGARYNSSGATHVGFADTVDSLAAIEAAVFAKAGRRCDFGTLLTSLENDLDDDPALSGWLTHRAPKYGTSSEAADRRAGQLVDFLYDVYQGYRNYRGGPYRPAYWTMTNHAGQGQLTDALPNGRRAQRPFASGITPVSQAAADLHGCLASVGSLNPLHIPGGQALNLKLMPSTAGDAVADASRLAALVHTWFASTGGMHVQFNMMSYERLLRAREDPTLEPHLLVRVSGYSAYFNDLNDQMKQEIITRTLHQLAAPEALAVPERVQDMLPSEAAGGARESSARHLPHGGPARLLAGAARRLARTIPTLLGACRLLLRALWVQRGMALRGWRATARARRRLLAGLEPEATTLFLDALIEAMTVGLRFSPGLRRSAAGFDATYRIRTEDGRVDVGLIFRKGHLRSADLRHGHDGRGLTPGGADWGSPDAELLFRDAKALMHYFTISDPDLFSALIHQDVTVENNVNYVYRLAYLARRAQLEIMAPLRGRH